MTRQETMTRTQQRQRQRFERAIQFIFYVNWNQSRAYLADHVIGKCCAGARALAQRPKRTWARRQYFVKCTK